MTKLTITGNTTPTVGIIETYALSVFDHSAPPNVFQPNLSKKAEWYIEILEKGSWKKSKGDHKEGDAVTFRFSQRSLSRKAIKIVVKRGEDKGELLIKPQRAKEAKITRVELLDENYQPIPKGKILNYHDTLIARAHCVEMFWNYISFTLWEDDAKGEGHDPVMNMMNKINPIPLRGEVNEKGIAEVTFRLPFYTMAVQIANAHIATGDTDEGPTHEYYVTAELVSKHIMKASPNVNVANPTHLPPTPPSKTSSNTPEEKPQKPKPKADTPKFKISSNGKKQADPDAKILNAEFLNQRGQPIEKAEVGDTVIIKITTQNMKGRNVTVRIWEEETGYKTYDKIYEKKWVLPGNENFIKVPITKRIYELGITPEDFKNEKYDYKFQVYFIEIEPDNTHVTSQVIPISKTAPKLEVENSPSVAIIKKPRIVEKKEEKGKCPRCKEKITITQIENLFGTYTKHRSYRQEIIDNLNKYIFDSGKEIHINTCLRKAHFFAQVGAETLGMNPDWMVETDVYRYSKNRCFEVFGERAKNLNAKGLLDKYCMDNPQKRLLNYLYAHENGFGNGNRNEASGDGYIYRGRGLKQLTGKENYKNASQYIKEYFPNEYIDLVEDPDKVKTAKYAVLSAIAYWEKHEIWKVADTLKVSNDENIKKIRKIVNPGLAGWKDAKSYFEKGISVFLVNKCTPVKKENSKSKSEWHDPIDYSQRTYYNSSGAHKEQNGAFGPVRTKIVKGNAIPKNHQGLDIFANINTPCKACLDGKIVSYTNEGANGYGNVLVLEVNGDDLRKAKRDYKLEFSAEKENGSGFNMDADKFYLRYAHLKSAVKTSGEVDAGDTICFSGDSGNASGVPNPHLHFEIAMKPTKNGSGLTNRYNPAFFVRLKPIVQKIQDDVKKERTKK